ncbi:MAG: carbon-phosphorus lyase complex subunit PhnI [Spirochaetes bacterium]|nr:carbon-phosphorus lyase complex subunit PhnI [Spirochaetota bacterium]
MGYIGVKGGKDAITNSEKTVDYYRKKNKDKPVELEQIKNQMRLAVDKVMSEGSLYCPEIAALAVKQAEGDLLEASYLVRAFRSTLPRVGYSIGVKSDEMFIIRRISSSFQDIPGGQILGPSRDYSLRLLDFKLINEEKFNADPPRIENENISNEPDIFKPMEKVIDYLRKESLLEYPVRNNNKKPYDITRDQVNMPLERSARLQRLTRGEEGAILAFGYASMRGWGSVHPTLAEVRVGYMPVKIRHPHWNFEVTIGRITATEVDSICSFKKDTVVSESGEKEIKYNFTLGYGFVFGHNDKKAIAMSILDRTLSEKENNSPVKDQEFVLYHIDGIESQGFISHLKLPHYVTFQSAMDRLRSMKKNVFHEDKELIASYDE